MPPRMEYVSCQNPVPTESRRNSFHHCWWGSSRVQAFEMVQDTPYQFTSIDEFSCDPNRGTPGNPLLLVNHWLAIDPPDPNAAAEANTLDVLLERAERCAALRERTANIIAVDFYGNGDLLAAIDELNGV